MLTITVGTAITPEKDIILDKELDVSREMKLIKAALLYADKVRFYSYGPSAMLSIMKAPKNMNEEEKIEWFLNFYKNLGNKPNYDKVLKFITDYRKAQKLKLRNLKNYLLHKEALETSFRKLDVTVRKAGIDELDNALKSGLIEFQPFAVDKDAEVYVDEIAKILTSGNSYPLFDESTSNIIDLAITAKVIHPIGRSVVMAKQAKLSSNLFEKLPVLERATINEIIDIRGELNKSLSRFRSAIILYSKEIETVPWQEKFEFESDQLYLQYIVPALQDIDESFNANKSILEIVKRTLTDPGVISTSVMGIAISQASKLPEVITSLSVIGGLVGGAYSAIKEKREKNQEIEKNQLYFYYRLSNIK